MLRAGGPLLDSSASDFWSPKRFGGQLENFLIPAYVHPCLLTGFPIPSFLSLAWPVGRASPCPSVNSMKTYFKGRERGSHVGRI